jgi:hypothetical protein
LFLNRHFHVSRLIYNKTPLSNKKKLVKSNSYLNLGSQMLRISSDLNNGLYFYLFPVKLWETSILRRFLRFLYLFKSVDLLILLNKIGLTTMNSTANSNAQIPQFDSSSAIMNT